jgi:signal transduction histidine kinase
MQNLLLEKSQTRSRFSPIERQVQQIDPYLERQLQKRIDQLLQQNLQLQQALEFETTLNRIKDKLYQSLDESQILQTTVVELTQALGVSCCNAVLGDLQQNPSNIRYAYGCAIPGHQGHAIAGNSFPEFYQEPMQGQPMQLCSIIPDPVFGRVVRFACPMLDGEQPVGQLWVITPPDRVLNEWEMGMVQQVASVCAIAIRQTQLYQAAQARIAELEKLNRDKDDFINLIAHELRSPMTSMRLSIQTLQSVLPYTRSLDRKGANCKLHCDKCLDYVQILDKESQREISLLNDLLDLQRLEAGYQSNKEVSTIQLEDWIKEVAEPFERQALSRQQTLILDLKPNLLSLVSDPTVLSRILSELLNNACKYTPPGKTITLKTSTKSGRVQLKVSNSGVKIPASELPKIFEKFYRVPDGDPWRQGGTGLGLAIVKKLVERLGGTIQVKSAAKQTCFTVELPRS